jgi:L-arabinonolactonase
MTEPASGGLDLLHDGQNYLGECVIWCDRSHRVFWTDIGNARLHSLDLTSGQHHDWTLPERLACFALTQNEDVLLLGLATRLAFFNLDTGHLSELHQIETDLAATRLNDGRCDREGRFVFGTIDETPARDPIASYYRLNHDLTLEKLPLPPLAISNSTCFSVDGSVMYFCDSMNKQILRWDGYGSGDADAISVFTDLGPGPASPDGATIDSQGYLWSAQWGGSRVVRYTPDGAIDRILYLPVSQPSCVCLGGALLDTLYVTTAQENMTAGMLADEPLAGGLFHTVLSDVTGLAEVRFGGAVPVAGAA